MMLEKFGAVEIYRWMIKLRCMSSPEIKKSLQDKFDVDSVTLPEWLNQSLVIFSPPAWWGSDKQTMVFTNHESKVWWAWINKSTNMTENKTLMLVDEIKKLEA